MTQPLILRWVPDRFRGGALSKAALMGATGIHAAIDDGLLDIPFKVLGFETVFFDNMGNASSSGFSRSQFLGHVSARSSESCQETVASTSLISRQ